MKRIAVLFLMVALAGVARAEDGKSLFDSKCAACHGKDGKAKKMGSPDISALKGSQADIEKVITQGKGKMKPYKASLTPEQIQEVAKYVKGGLK
ncbi:MAG TPA: cytochrome c [Anaeromyxobacteraceae bacterium]|nr:cytochrome c [Anaeromyxobacteraceae bacterium]